MLKDRLAAGPLKIKSPLVGEVYLALDDGGKVPSGICYFYSEVNYLASVKNPRAALGALHRLKRAGLKPVLDPRPDYPDSFVWTALLTFVRSEALRGLLLALRGPGAARLDKNLAVRPAPGYEDAYAFFRPKLANHSEELVAALNKLKRFLHGVKG